MEIRKIKKNELNDLLALYSHLHTSDDPLPVKTKVSTVWNEIQSNPNLPYFGLYIDNKLVSSCSISIIPNLTRGCRPYGLIENVVTHKDFRKKGYGTDILRRALQYAWSKNCYKVMLMTGRKDEATLNFYTSAGFDKHEKQAFIAKP